MGVVGDIFKIIVKGRIRGQAFLNVFFYELDSGTMTAVGAGLDFDARMMDDLSDIVPTEFEYEAIDIENLFDPTDFTTLAPSIANGQWIGDDLGNFTAARFDFPSSNKAIRSGGKRIGPVPEDIATDGVIDNGAYLLELNSLAVAMLASLDNGTGVAGPVVVKRIREVDPVTGDVTYRLPQNQGEAVTYPVDVVLPNTQLTTQNSRKAGVGA